MILSFIIPTTLGTYDFSIIPTKLNFIISLLATYILAKYFSLKSNFTERDFSKILLSVFLIQSLVILSMLMSPNLAELIISITRNSEQGSRVIETYGGARGLGLADSSAFGLAIVMGLFIFLTFYCYKQKFISLNYFIILITIGSIASISAGRTAILGLLFGLLYLIINLRNLRSILILILLSILSVISLSFLLNINSSNIENKALQVLYNYSMEPILNYTQTGSFSSRSTDDLQTMYFFLTESQHLHGDGKYMIGDKYYMETDAGFMRFSLFYGTIISTFLYLYFIKFTIKVYGKNKKYLLPILLLVTLSFILHYKGEVILFAVSYNKVLFLILFYIYLRSFNPKTSGRLV